MNREIKFRLWNPERKVITAGLDLNTLLTTTDGEFVKEFDRCKMVWTQYTGIKDNNGKEIYEGDVVKYKQTERFGAYVSEHTIEVKYEGYGFAPMKYHSINEEDGFYSCAISDIEVIGNIYENPELIPVVK